ncbi:hypothetical protein JCM10207_000096 [Rhodosporidiobolus poonsookiae]
MLLGRPSSHRFSTLARRLTRRKRASHCVADLSRRTTRDDVLDTPATLDIVLPLPPPPSHDFLPPLRPFSLASHPFSHHSSGSSASSHASAPSTAPSSAPSRSSASSCDTTPPLERFPSPPSPYAARPQRGADDEPVDFGAALAGCFADPLAYDAAPRSGSHDRTTLPPTPTVVVEGITFELCPPGLSANLDEEGADWQCEDDAAEGQDSGFATPATVESFWCVTAGRVEREWAARDGADEV